MGASRYALRAKALRASFGEGLMLIRRKRSLLQCGPGGGSGPPWRHSEADGRVVGRGRGRAAASRRVHDRLPARRACDDGTRGTVGTARQSASAARMCRCASETHQPPSMTAHVPRASAMPRTPFQCSRTVPAPILCSRHVDLDDDCAALSGCERAFMAPL